MTVPVRQLIRGAGAGEPNEPPNSLPLTRRAALSGVRSTRTRSCADSELGEASRYSWKDVNGREWEGLY